MKLFMRPLKQKQNQAQPSSLTQTRAARPSRLPIAHAQRRRTKFNKIEARGQFTFCHLNCIRAAEWQTEAELFGALVLARATGPVGGPTAAARGTKDRNGPGPFLLGSSSVRQFRMRLVLDLSSNSNSNSNLISISSFSSASVCAVRGGRDNNGRVVCQCQAAGVLIAAAR